MASSCRLSAFLSQSLPIPVSRASWRRCPSLLSESSSESSSLEDLPSSGRFSLSQSLCLPGCIFVGVFFSSSLPSSGRVFLPQSLWLPGCIFVASSPRLYGAASESWWVSPRSALCGGRTFIEALSFNVCLFLRPKALGNAAPSPGNVPLLETPSAAPGNVPLLETLPRAPETSSFLETLPRAPETSLPPKRRPRLPETLLPSETLPPSPNPPETSLCPTA